MRLHMLVPTRGRPANARRLIEACSDTIVLHDTHFTFFVDDDDPAVDAYTDVFTDPKYDGFTWFGFVTGARRGLNGTLNHHILSMTKNFDFVGFMGDDHAPLTRGWDLQFGTELRAMKMGFVYGDDLIQHDALPTAVAMTVNIPRTLGFIAPPTLHHMYLDNFWRDMGRAIGRISYLRDVVIEHKHPIAHKAEWDATYVETNAGEVYERDRRAYEAYLEVNFANDVSKLETVKGGL